jgi:ubiquinone/menaquinone biosynthesis C-methylase UbiE
MSPDAVYDEIADWYEDEFLARTGEAGTDVLGIERALRDLLSGGSGICLEIGCGTGARAAQVRALGWTPLGLDLSAGMLRRTGDRLPVVLADARQLPLPDNCVPAVIAVMVHTDMPGYPAVLREAARVLRPGGIVVHIGVHPCYCGGFADRSDPAARTLPRLPQGWADPRAIRRRRRAHPRGPGPQSLQKAPRRSG